MLKNFMYKKQKKETKQNNSLNVRRRLCAYDGRVDGRLQK